jgi:hypothetical protein
MKMTKCEAIVFYFSSFGTIITKSIFENGRQNWFNYSPDFRS